MSNVSQPQADQEDISLENTTTKESKFDALNKRVTRLTTDHWQVIIAAIGLLVTAIVLVFQLRIMTTQTELLARQTAANEHQTQLNEQQTKLMAAQTELLKRQTGISAEQKEQSERQSSIMTQQSSLMSKQTNLMERQTALDRQVYDLNFSPSVSIVFENDQFDIINKGKENIKLYGSKFDQENPR